MKRYLSGLVTGIVLTLLMGSLVIGALAVSGNVSFNLSAIKFNGEVISEAGEGYALPNGCVAPASITYTDEKGGGTTYLPARRVSELLGVDIGWDSASGAVTIGDAAPATPDTTANVSDTEEELPIDNNGKTITDFEVDTRGGLYIAGEEIISDAPKNIVVGALDYYNFELAASYLAPDRSFDPEYYMGLTHIWTNKYFTYKGYHFIPALELIEYLGLHRADCKYDKDTGLHLMEGN